MDLLDSWVERVIYVQSSIQVRRVGAVILDRQSVVPFVLPDSAAAERADPFR